MSSIRNSRNRATANLTALSVTPSEWRTRSACLGQRDLPWFDDDNESVAVCLPICRQCSVRTECLEEALSYDAASEHAQAGTMGASTSAQRSWLTHNPELADEVHTACTTTGVDPDELADWWHAAGPEDLPVDAADIKERDIAPRWGVNKETWHSWLVDRGLRTRSNHHQRDKHHIEAYDAIERHLRRCHSDGIEWEHQINLADVVADAMPLSAITPTVTAQQRSARRAWHNVVAGVIQSWEREGGLIERCPNPDYPQRMLVRWIGP